MYLLGFGKLDSENFLPYRWFRIRRFNCNLGKFTEIEWIELKIAGLLGLSQTRANQTHKQRLDHNG